MITKKQIVCQSELLNIGMAPAKTENREPLGTRWLTDPSVLQRQCPSPGGEQALIPS